MKHIGMGKVFAASLDDSFFDALVQHVLGSYTGEEIYQLKVVLPCSKDIVALVGAFDHYKTEQHVILPEVISLENICEEKLVLNADRVKVIHPIKKILLLIKFILEWNKNNSDNIPIDLSHEVSLLQHFNISQVNHEQEKHGKFSEFLVKSYNKSLKDLNVIDTLEYRSSCIEKLILSLNEDHHIILIAVDKDKTYRSLIKAVYNLPFGTIILPNLNLEIEESEWNTLSQNHYQYYLKSLLEYLNATRHDVRYLGNAPSLTFKVIDYIFDVTTDLNRINNYKNDNIDVITCNSAEEEAQVISLIVKHHEYKNVSLVTNNEVLSTRVACLLGTSNSESYTYITLMLYSIELVISSWSNVALFSLLKHTFVTFGYPQGKYNDIISEFEIKVLRNFNAKTSKEILYVVNQCKKLIYKEEIIHIISALDGIYNLLLEVIDCTISEVIDMHLQCINLLSGIDILYLNNSVGTFIGNLVNECRGLIIECSLEKYYNILTVLLKKHFLSPSTQNGITEFSLLKDKVVILADFDEINYRSNFRESSSIMDYSLIQEEQGYFLSMLHNLFYTNSVYITRSAAKKKSILLRRIEMLGSCNMLKQPYRKWLKILNSPERIAPCTRPAPSPNKEVRKETMKIVSCNAVEKLIRDPYSFYVKYILNIRKIKDLNANSGMLEFGIVIHNIFERYLRTTESLVDVAKSEFSSKNFYFSSIWWARLQMILKSFATLSENYNQGIMAERNFSVPITKDILLTVRCDRVEYLPNNQAVIIDYKLGNIPSHYDIMSGFFPQLILQELAVEHTTKKNVLKLGYWKFEYKKIHIVYLQNYKQKMQEFQDNLHKFLFAYLDKDVPFIASPYLDKFIRFNDCNHLERSAEWI